MTALLLNGYASGIYSSRRIANACRERADFMMIVAGDDRRGAGGPLTQAMRRKVGREKPGSRCR